MNHEQVALDTQLPIHDAVREAALMLVPELSIEARQQINDVENDSANRPPEPIGEDAHVFLRAYHNHPRELSRQRPDVLPAIIHSTPVIIRTQQHSWAEQTSMIVALEAADSDLVPVIATFRAPHHHRAHHKASEATPEIDRDHLSLTLHLPHGQSRTFPMRLVAHGRYRHDDPNSHLNLSVRDPANADPHKVRQFLIRAFQPDLDERLRRQRQSDQTDPANAALTLAHQADHTVRALLHSQHRRRS